MRVIAGKYRGRTLASFEQIGVRPTSDRVKESLFGILSPVIVGARVLDLFAGSGSLGIESLSRGASFVRFNDNSGAAIALLKKNLSFLREENFKVGQADFKRCLSLPDRYDVVFIDPPYASDCAREALSLVAGRLTQGGVAVLENEGEALLVSGLVCYDSRSYGRTKLHFYRGTP